MGASLTVIFVIISIIITFIYFNNISFISRISQAIHMLYQAYLFISLNTISNINSRIIQGLIMLQLLLGVSVVCYSIMYYGVVLYSLYGVVYLYGKVG